MPPRKNWRKIGPEVFAFADACNVYVLRHDDRAIAVDFGSGQWLDHLGEIGVRRVEHVVLTHAHRDQCCGLYRDRDRPFTVHAPASDAPLLDAAGLWRFWNTYQDGGCPTCYAAPRLPVGEVAADLGPDTELLLGPARFCAIATPGHTVGALSYIVEWHGRHLAFCGDAVHSGGTVHQPYHLEWDHWTPSGAREAWYGLERLNYCYFDLLLPSHERPVQRQARSCVSRAQKRLMDLIRAKGSVCAGEKARWLDLEAGPAGSGRVLPHLYHFGGNSFLLVGRAGAGMVIDPTRGGMPQLEELAREVGVTRIEVATASHYHADHTDGLNPAREQCGAAVWLHPSVAAPIRDRDRLDVPWLPSESISVDRMLPGAGSFRWNEYRFGSRAFPGQTEWHCALDARIDGRHVLFSGDSFQPPTRWNGTGGFCAFNGSRFREGFRASAQAVLDLAPEIICNGHGGIYRFAPSHYRRILRWSEQAEAAIRALCPTASWQADYDHRAARWEPFVSRARPGQALTLELVQQNYGRREARVAVSPAGPEGWRLAPTARQVRIPPGKSRRLTFSVQIPGQAGPGRHLIAADLVRGGHRQAEACVALVEVNET